MKLLHIADLHIGKRLGEFPLIADQRHILDQILQIAVSENADGVLIAGDVYDKSQPSAEAVELLDGFLTALSAAGKSVFIISGNHDSPERLHYGSRLLKTSGLYIAGVYGGAAERVTLSDEHGAVNFFLLPFIKPAMAQPFFDETLDTYEDAVAAALARAEADPAERNVLLAHQFVTSGAQEPERSGSENISVGGLDNVDARVFEKFDYVALGHLHRPQRIGRDTIRYAGSPLKYSVSEATRPKSAALVELGAKGDIDIRLIPLTPLRDLRAVKGPIAGILSAGREDAFGGEDYIHAALTDEDEIYDAVGQLRQVYPNLLSLEFENSRGPRPGQSEPGSPGAKSPMELFREFYLLQNNRELTSAQELLMEQIFERAGEEAQ